MSEIAALGATATLTRVVTDDDTAASFGAHFPRAAATPWILGLAEVACHNVVASELDAGMVTVGTHASIKHIAPTPVGAAVTATARLVERDGRRLKFEVSLDDGSEICATLTHDRAVVAADVISQRLAAKEGSTR
jgi:predicted thioesterase